MVTQRARVRLGAAVALWSAAWALAAPPPAEPPRVVHLQAQAEQRLAHDWVVVTLAARLQGAEAIAVQAQLRATVQQALAQLRPQQQEELLEVSSGALSVQPRYGREGQIVGWQGSAELHVQGRDLARIATATQGLSGMAPVAVRLELARPSRRAAEAALRQQAIESFRRQADEVAQAFGARGWVLREANVGMAQGAGAGGDPPGMRVMSATPAPGGTADAWPLEPGLTWLQVTVTGSIVLQP